ncbi:hypothetical protein SAMN05216200_1032 [Oceanicella actignis]|uniref:Uncharacterized protein n=1 Tax=Oceanicella actignis TaxID=1189325 RepID=A0A1M7SN08_9RHOB|nr:hypothetical protein SAMN05216200_1032 [Oceanicella actignis]
MREFDAGVSREDAEALAAEDAARAPGPPMDRLRAAAMPETPALDPEGLPFAACSACDGGDWWKPAVRPAQGPGWRCASCDPPSPGRTRRACSVPTRNGPQSPLLAPARKAPRTFHPWQRPKPTWAETPRWRCAEALQIVGTVAGRALGNSV